MAFSNEQLRDEEEDPIIKNAGKPSYHMHLHPLERLLFGAALAMCNDSCLVTYHET